MINNRQGGRRRGRGGGGRAPNMSPGAGNRQDNRQRGNAAQLLEKYKGLARDMQMQGDRVQTEYYLQFADHYYRILNENRARYEEQRRQQGGYEGSYEDEDQEELEAANDGRERQPAEEAESGETRQADGRRDDMRRQGNGEFRSRRQRGRYEDREPASESTDEGQDERIAADILPPSIGPMGGDEADEGDAEARAPRRRPRRPRGEPGEDIAPAA